MKKPFHRLRYYLNDWFELNLIERKGSIVLVVLIVLMIVYNFSAVYLFSPKISDNSHLKKEVADWLASIKQEKEETKSKTDFNELLLEQTEHTSRKLFKFNPNTASDAELSELGFTQRQIESLRKYLNKGGSFKIRNDFSKMYFVSEKKFQELYTYINLPEKVDYAYNENWQNQNTTNNALEPVKTSYPRYDYSNLKVEINSADTTELKKIKGIGSFTAKNIVRFRENLGGFTSIEQLAEVYPLNKEKMDSIRQYLLVDSGLMQKININEVSAEQMSKHPYLSSAQAKSLIAYRNMHGNFKQVEDIKKSALIDQKTYDKVKDYLRVN